MKYTCPVCKGTGEYQTPRKLSIDSVEIKRRMTIELRKKGYSIRQIMTALEYRSPRSIQLFLK